MDSIISVIEARADALTCSFHEAKAADAARRRADVWAAQEKAEGNKVGNFRTHGYDAWQVGRVACGVRPDGVLVKLTDDLAEMHLEELVSTASNISRVDFAVTARCTPRLQDVALLHYSEALAHYADNPRSAEPSHEERATGGDTCYLGRRTSDWFFRCYNKEQESLDLDDERRALHYAGCWRYEVEIKGPNAGIQARHYVGLADTRSWVTTMVWDYANKHGLVPIFGIGGPAWIPSSYRRRSDRESKLAWLAKSVRPTVGWLLSNTDRATILATLGLAEQAGSRPDE
jgi:hypothetical protein